MLHALDFVLAAVIALGLPLRALYGYRRLQTATPAEMLALKPRLYVRAIASQWTLVAAMAALWLWQGRGAEGLKLLPRLTWGLGGVAVGMAFVVPAMLRLRRQLAADGELRANLRRQLEGASRLLPATDAEHRLFNAVAITAGTCEELLFRGYLVWFAAHFVPLLGAHALVALSFGVGHAYQGPRGILRTGLAGAFLSGVVLLTGMLWPAMLIHAAMDLNAGDLGRRAGEVPAAAPLEEASS